MKSDIPTSGNGGYTGTSLARPYQAIHTPTTHTYTQTYTNQTKT